MTRCLIDEKLERLSRGAAAWWRRWWWQRHLAGCAACRSRWEASRKTSGCSNNYGRRLSLPNGPRRYQRHAAGLCEDWLTPRLHPVTIVTELDETRSTNMRRFQLGTIVLAAFALTCAGCSRSKSAEEQGGSTPAQAAWKNGAWGGAPKAPDQRDPGYDPSNNPWEQAINPGNGATPMPGVPQRAKHPLEKLGWDRTHCLLCQAQRVREEAVRYSDRYGFGFCATCGVRAEAFSIARANMQRGFDSPVQVQRLAKDYANLFADRYPLYWVAFSSWRDEPKWKEAWSNFATITGGPQAGDR